MITLTTEATDAIRELVGNAELPDTGGLRLDMNDGTMNSAPPSLALTLVESPATGDEVIDEGGVHVYVSRRPPRCSTARSSTPAPSPAASPSS